MDLDDDKLKATRRMNGSDKNVGSIEKLIEELTKVRPDELSKEGLKLFEYINEIIDRNKELEEKWDKDTHTLQNALDLANADKINNYTPNSKIKEKIEEIDKEIEYQKLYGNVSKREELETKKEHFLELLEGEQNGILGKDYKRI